MKDKEVLQKAIEVAAKKGSVTASNYEIRMSQQGGYGSRVVCMMACFSHDFAKAFWGEGEKCLEPNLKRVGVGQYLTEDIQSWQYHLQQMVLEDNPIDYLRKFVE